MSDEVNCKGCLHFEDQTKACGVALHKYDTTCPCATCLVKMVCDSECPEFIWFYGYVNQDRRWYEPV